MIQWHCEYSSYLAKFAKKKSLGVRDLIEMFVGSTRSQSRSRSVTSAFLHSIKHPKTSFADCLSGCSPVLLSSLTLKLFSSHSL